MYGLLGKPNWGKLLHCKLHQHDNMHIWMRVLVYVQCCWSKPPQSGQAYVWRCPPELQATLHSCTFTKHIIKHNRVFITDCQEIPLHLHSNLICHTEAHATKKFSYMPSPWCYTHMRTHTCTFSCFLMPSEKGGCHIKSLYLFIFFLNILLLVVYDCMRTQII